MSATNLARSNNHSQKYLEALESQMKDLWSKYIHCLDTEGISEKARALRSQYFNLYREYRQHRNWKSSIHG